MILLPALTVMACKLYALEVVPSVVIVTSALLLLAAKSVVWNVYLLRE